MLLVAQKNMTPPKNIFKNCVLGKAKLGLFLNTKAFCVLAKSQAILSDELNPSKNTKKCHFWAS
jgi:hypothetical protein